MQVRRGVPGAVQREPLHAGGWFQDPGGTPATDAPA